MASARVETTTRTIHTLTVSLSDDALANVNPTDDVELVITWRNGQASPKRLTYRDLMRMMEGKGW